MKQKQEIKKHWRQLYRGEALIARASIERCLNRALSRSSAVPFGGQPESRNEGRNRPPRLLTGVQADYIVQIQKICMGLRKLTSELNGCISYGQLEVPPLQIGLVEITQLLVRLDNRIYEAKSAARRLGMDVDKPAPDTEWALLDMVQKKLKNDLEGGKNGGCKVV